MLSAPAKILSVDPAARLLRLLSLLQSRPRWPAAELAERLDVDRRTIRRDIARLRSLGYPVQTESGLAGYQLGAGGRLPPLLLDDDEAVAIAVGLGLAATSAVTGIETAAAAAMAKLDQVLPSQVRERVRSLRSSTVQLDASLRDPIDAAILSALAGACRSSERVHFSYRAFAGEVTQRRVEPSQIVHTGQRWYLVAKDLDRDAWRSFRVDRINDVKRTGHRFEHQDAPDAAAQARAAVTFSPPAIEATLLVDLAPDVARRRFYPDRANVEPAGQRSRVHLSGTDLDQLARYVLSLPYAVDVEAPEELRQRVVDIARAVIERHDSREPGMEPHRRL